jgi:hypothetical protein
VHIMLNLPAPETGESPGIAAYPGTTAPRTSGSPRSKSPGTLVGPGAYVVLRVSYEEDKIAVDSKCRASIRNYSYTIPSQSISPIVTYLARGDFAGPGNGNYHAKSKV